MEYRRRVRSLNPNVLEPVPSQRLHVAGHSRLHGRPTGNPTVASGNSL